MTEGKELEESNLGYMMATSTVTVHDGNGVSNYSLRELAYLFHNWLKLREELDLEEFDG